MAVKVFISHTKKDEKFCDIFDRACSRVGIAAFRSEFEEIEKPEWRTIRDEIRQSVALFFLVGEELVKFQEIKEKNQEWSYTRNWIAYEIGIACNREIDVWVLCDEVKINFPVPYFNNYFPYSIRNTYNLRTLIIILKVFV